jgi:hypothetical protein
MPAAVRFQARRSNELWHFDLSLSDLKEVEKPIWFELGRGSPTLMLYSVVDDRCGVADEEYRPVYGEEVEAGLRFPVQHHGAQAREGGLVMQGIPDALYLDNGPITRSRVFQNVMECLGVRVMTHLPAGRDGRRVMARSKGKVERPFRTVKAKPCTISTGRRTKQRPTCGCTATWLTTMVNRTASNRKADWRTGSGTYPSSGCGRCAPGSVSGAFAREPERRLVAADGRGRDLRGSGRSARSVAPAM